MERITLSVFRADVGGFVGHTGMHEDVADRAREALDKAKGKGTIIDARVLHVGDDLELVVTHDRRENSKETHELAWDTFTACAETARKLKLYNPGQDLYAESFDGNVRGLGPGCAEIGMRERPSEPVVILLADTCSCGAWNLPLYKIFADPFNTSGLVIDPSMHEGFAFEVLDVVENTTITLQCPADIYDLVMFLGSRDRYEVTKVIRRVDGIVAAASSAQKLMTAGEKTTGRGDPVLIARAENGLPSVGEITEPFAFPHLVGGWLHGAHQGPLMPVTFKDSASLRFDGPPRVIAAGFQLSGGRLLGPVDLFDDPGFEPARRQAAEIADYMRRHGPFEPHRLPHDRMEATPFPDLMARLESRFVKNDHDDDEKSSKKGRKKHTPTEDND